MSVQNQHIQYIFHFSDHQNSGSCFLNRHPCFDKFATFVMTSGSCSVDVLNHIFIIQKFFFGDIVIPFTCLLWSASTHIVSPQRSINSVRQTSGTTLFTTLYEKQPPFRFFGSSHIGVIPSRITNDIQFLIIFSFNSSFSVITCSKVSIELIITE